MYKKKITLALVGFVGLALSGIAGAVDTRTRFMAANCSYCHGPDGKSHGAIPSLAGVEPGYFVEQMKAFRDGSRRNELDISPYLHHIPNRSLNFFF